jgi:hypothetical protein
MVFTVVAYVLAQRLLGESTMKFSSTQEFIAAMQAQGVVTVADFLAAFPGKTLRECK